MQRLFRYVILSLLAIAIAACHHSTPASSQNDEGSEAVIIRPYGQDLFALDPTNLKPGLESLLDRYSFFLGDEIDTQKVLQIRDFIMDHLNRELAEKCAVRYNDISFLQKGMGHLFYQCKLNFPGFSVPIVYTYVSGLLYEMPVQYLDSVMIIGLDLYLGKDYEPYHSIGLPFYMARRMEKEDILPECARQIAISKMQSGATPKSLLDHMISEGKVLYALDILLPGTEDSLKIGYTKAQAEWSRNNEKNVWRYLIDQELLYSTDPQVISKFIQDGPFTAGLPEGAPAMLGKWIGWQIVRSYMNRQGDVTLTQLTNAADSQLILDRSGYKPKK